MIPFPGTNRRTTTPPTRTSTRYQPRRSQPRDKAIRDRLDDQQRRRVITAPTRVPSDTLGRRTRTRATPRSTTPSNGRISVPRRTRATPTDRVRDIRTTNPGRKGTNVSTRRGRTDTGAARRTIERRNLERKAVSNGLRRRYERHTGRKTTPDGTGRKNVSPRPADNSRRLPGAHRYGTRRGEKLRTRTSGTATKRLGVVPDPLITVDSIHRRSPFTRSVTRPVGSRHRNHRSTNWFVGAGYGYYGYGNNCYPYAGYNLFNPVANYGRFCWTGHYSSLSFAFGCAPRYRSWGVYSFPYYYGSLWPYTANTYCRPQPSIGVTTFASASYSPYYRSSAWWWPNDCYEPGSWSSTTAYPSTVVIDAEPAVAAPAEETEDDLVSVARRHIDLGDYYFTEGRYDEAAEAWLRALAYVPDDPSLHLVVADALFALGDYQYAAFLIARGLELDPTLATSDVDKRDFYGDASDFDEQLKTLRGFLERHPEDENSWLVLGYNLRFSGDLEGAREALERARSLEPDLGGVTELLSALPPTGGDAEPAAADSRVRRV